MQSKNIILFNTTSREDWFKSICQYRNNYSQEGNGVNVSIDFKKDIKIEALQPFHLATLACLIQWLSDKGYKAYLKYSNKEVSDYIYNTLKFSEYWKGGRNHVEVKSPTNNIFNLWRIVNSEKDIYAKQVENYFKQTEFQEKDLSSLSVCMAEAYYNVFDHAKAGNNAFSIISYDDKKKILHSAICDFGIGIARSVRDYDNSIVDDEEALKTAVLNNFSVKSQGHNKGKGLDNILTNSDELRIVSGEAFLYSTGSQRKTYHLPYYFRGTLIYFDVDLSKLEDEEILNEFDLFT